MKFTLKFFNFPDKMNRNLMSQIENDFDDEELNYIGDQDLNQLNGVKTPNSGSDHSNFFSTSEELNAIFMSDTTTSLGKKDNKKQITHTDYHRKSNNVILSREAILFREQFYSIFLGNIKGKRVIPKSKVVEIHNFICSDAGVRKMQRHEYRVINNYFQNFCEYRPQIISSIVKNKEKLSELIDLPSIIKRAEYIAVKRKERFN